MRAMDVDGLWTGQTQRAERLAALDKQRMLLEGLHEGRRVQGDGVVGPEVPPGRVDGEAATLAVSGGDAFRRPQGPTQARPVGGPTATG